MSVKPEKPAKQPMVKSMKVLAVDPRAPVQPPLASQMTVDIMVNEDSDVWVLFDKPLGEVVKWAEYDADDAKVTLVLLSGKQRELGFPIPEEMMPYLIDGQKLYLIRMEQGQIADCGIVPLIVRNMTMN